jgi:ech hydrogenase subunit A
MEVMSFLPQVEVVSFLLLFPFLAAAALLLLRTDLVRNIFIVASAILIAAASIFLLASGYGSGVVYYVAGAEPTTQMMFYAELLIALGIIYLGLRYKKMPVVALAAVQTLMAIYLEANFAHGLSAENNLFTDQLSIIMALIIGVIGSLICVYAIGYMRDFHHHNKDVKDHRNIFFFVMFLFLSAMFGLVFSNNLLWLYFFWEITTVCSFVLIGYTRTHEAVNNAFLALAMNLLGGIAFMGAILYLASSGGGIIELDRLLASGKAVALLPAVLISFAGLTKAAQMPFSSWLVGAMVAPTPVSALLHSSTMVKAGVYVIIRLAPLLAGSLSGYMISLVGAFTFLLASGIAISQSNAKKVLAYSTIANLGLVVACAGVGTYEAVWAAILLVIFHAISKSLMFLCVGTVEHRISSRDIEDMGGLILRMPKLTVMMLIGMSGMFLAPFGMLISKWATLRAFIDASPLLSPLLIGIIAYGGAVTVFFWTKWMGRLIEVTHLRKSIEDKISLPEWSALYILAALTVLVCLLFPVVSSTLVEPFIEANYVLPLLDGQVNILGQSNLTIMLLMLVLIMLMPFSMLYYGRERKHISAYMCGRPTTADMKFSGSLGITRELSLRNYYMQNYFGEARLLRAGTILSVGVMALMIWGVSFGVILI